MSEVQCLPFDVYYSQPSISEVRTRSLSDSGVPLWSRLPVSRATLMPGLTLLVKSIMSKPKGKVIEGVFGKTFAVHIPLF